MTNMSNASTPLPSITYALVVDGEVASNFRVCVALEPIAAAMSSNPTITLATETEVSCVYELSVDGELATTINWSKDDPMVNAIFQSNPIVIELTDEQLEMGVGYGWLWDGTNFTEAS